MIFVLNLRKLALGAGALLFVGFCLGSYSAGGLLFLYGDLHVGDLSAAPQSQDVSSVSSTQQQLDAMCIEALQGPDRSPKPWTPMLRKNTTLLDAIAERWAHVSPNKLQNIGGMSGAGNDKGCYVPPGAGRRNVHCYTPFYFKLLCLFRTMPNYKVMEIGVATGCSLATWSEFFPKGQVLGVDIDPQFPKIAQAWKSMGAFTHDNWEFQQMDATKKEELHKLGGRTFNVIIDDGSHFAEHIVASFTLLFVDYLEPGGIYIIEDVCENDVENGLCARYSPPPYSTLKSFFFGRAEDASWHGHDISGDWARHNDYLKASGSVWTRWIESVEFLRHRIIIRKQLAG